MRMPRWARGLKKTGDGQAAAKKNEDEETAAIDSGELKENEDATTGTETGVAGVSRNLKDALTGKATRTRNQSRVRAKQNCELESCRSARGQPEPASQ